MWPFKKKQKAQPEQPYIEAELTDFLPEEEQTELLPAEEQTTLLPAEEPPQLQPAEEPVAEDAAEMGTEPVEAAEEEQHEEAAMEAQIAQTVAEVQAVVTSEEVQPEAAVEEAAPAETAEEAQPAEEADPFALDAIMREFGDTESAEPGAPVSGDTVRLEVPVTEKPADVTGDTIRIDLPVSGDTIRIDLPVVSDDIVIEHGEDDTLRVELPKKAAPKEDVTGDTVRFAPVSDEQTAAPATEDKPEPYAEGWEPEYEQPIGEYVPPQPILFHPRSRLRELKRKLVAGPERRYYEISEQGFVRLQFAIFVCLLVALLSTAATVAFEMGLLAERVKLVAFGQLFCMLIAALLGTYQLMDGVADIFKKRFSLNSLLVFSFLACIADGVFCLKAQRVPCCAAFSLQMTMSLWSAYQQRSTELGQMDTMRKATRLDSIVEHPDYQDGCTGLLRGEGQVEDFMDHYQDRSKMEKVTSVYAIVACCFSLVSGIVAGLLRGSVEFGVQVLAASLLASVPGTFFISQSRPMAILEKRLHKLGTVLCGWARLEKLCRRSVFPLSHEDLFPAGCTMLNGVKFYGTRDPDQVVAYATAIIRADGGGLTPLFEHLLASRNGRNYEVENLRLYGGGGIGGEVCGEPVLVGMQGFLKEMGVEIPEGNMVNQAVYVAVDGELCGVFAVSTSKSKSSAQGLHTLCSYRGLRPVLVTGDFMLTEAFVHETFGVNTRRFDFPEFEVRAELASKRAEKDAPALALATRDGLAGFAYAVTGARSVRTAAILGTVIHLLGGALGLGIILVLALLNATSLLTPVNMLLYQLIWMIPGLLVTEWTRVI